MKDVDAVKAMALRHIYLYTISYDLLDEFEGLVKASPNIKMSTVRTRFRRALNECVRQGIAKKSYQGTTAYQTGDTLGGKVYIDYDFSKWVAQL